MKNKRLIGILGVIAVILLLPLIGMQFPNSGVNWTGSDFMVAGALLLTTGLTLELVLRTVKTRNARIALCIFILAALFLIWAELAVGVFGSPFAGS